jgi:hypothetical protein
MNYIHFGKILYEIVILYIIFSLIFPLFSKVDVSYFMLIFDENRQTIYETET